MAFDATFLHTVVSSNEQQRSDHTRFHWQRKRLICGSTELASPNNCEPVCVTMQ